MNEELKKRFKRRLIIWICVMLFISATLSVACIYLKIQQVQEEKARYEAEYMNKYEMDLSSLDFLTDSEKKKYLRKVISACEAYDLVGLSKIIIANDSMIYNKDANLYEWSIYCDDTKETSFLCAFKNSTKAFTVERQYDEAALSYDDVEVLNETTASDDMSTDIAEEGRTEPALSGDAVEVAPADAPCKIKSIIYPDDCELLSDNVDKKNFKKELRIYLAYNGLTHTKEISFLEYNEYEGSTRKNELIFAVKGSKPYEINQISAVWDNVEWQFAVLW